MSKKMFKIAKAQQVKMVVTYWLTVEAESEAEAIKKAEEGDWLNEEFEGESERDYDTFACAMSIEDANDRLDTILYDTDGNNPCV